MSFPLSPVEVPNIDPAQQVSVGGLEIHLLVLYSWVQETRTVDRKEFRVNNVKLYRLEWSNVELSVE